MLIQCHREQELAAYVFADRLKLISISFQQHDNHLRNAAHDDKLLKNFALELSKSREIVPETLEGMSTLSPAHGLSRNYLAGGRDDSSSVVNIQVCIQG